MRYAIYFTPDADHALSRKAAAWLGRDVFSGDLLEQPSNYPIMGEELADITASPRRYGFHATLKQPFRLAEDVGEDDLVSAARAFRSSQVPFRLPLLCVGNIGNFFALIPSERSAQLSAFCEEVVREFEPLRAPLSEAEIARRNPSALSERQRAYLMQWGYPYVMEEFRFHMTLTGEVPPEEHSAISEILGDWFAVVLAEPLEVNALTIFVEPAPGEPFRVLEQVPLAPRRQAVSA